MGGCVCRLLQEGNGVEERPHKKSMSISRTRRNNFSNYLCGLEWVQEKKARANFVCSGKSGAAESTLDLLEHVALLCIRLVILLLWFILGHIIKHLCCHQRRLKLHTLLRFHFIMDFCNHAVTIFRLYVYYQMVAMTTPGLNLIQLPILYYMI
jgi:hypothetical protein